ncbi:hypothetical protein G7Z17_g12236 [Cylindrodendrum hubeiense]|uniref:Uncharacterized protein n=1 Tax=Cylindrodendrum hubeiense TaxID=595255 RepID=A0A9P5GZF9_9HYPO|nr:hypothetical protein G7Z17_g12236 [Cylindrodendrum hubeiense]
MRFETLDTLQRRLGPRSQTQDPRLSHPTSKTNGGAQSDTESTVMSGGLWGRVWDSGRVGAGAGTGAGDGRWRMAMRMGDGAGTGDRRRAFSQRWNNARAGAGKWKPWKPDPSQLLALATPGERCQPLRSSASSPNSPSGQGTLAGREGVGDGVDDHSKGPNTAQGSGLTRTGTGNRGQQTPEASHNAARKISVDHRQPLLRVTFPVNTVCTHGRHTVTVSDDDSDSDREDDDAAVEVDDDACADAIADTSANTNDGVGWDAGADDCE